MILVDTIGQSLCEYMGVYLLAGSRIDTSIFSKSEVLNRFSG